MKNVKVFYWLGEPNFGDMLNIDICQKLFNINPIETSPRDCEAAFIGSVLDDFLYKKALKLKKFYSLYNKQPIKIWGSGFITDENKFVKRKFKLPETYFRRFECYAVRGNKSLNRLKKINNKLELGNIVLADPGILASKLISKAPKKKYRVGIIPHHTELNLPIWEYLLAKIKNSTLIRVDDTVQNTINKIAECEVILSSAMHGLIVADSFNIPNARIIASNFLIGGDYKFNDYYSAYNINDHRKINLFQEIINETTIKSVFDNYKISEKQITKMQDDLIRVFPYQ